MACIPAEAQPTEEYVTTERVAVVVRLLTLGRRLTTAQVAEMVGVGRGGAWAMLSRIARVTPLYLGEDGRWEMFMRGDEY